MRKHARRSRSAGFTLVEALCAGVVLATGAMLVGLGASHAYATAQLARDKHEAAEVLDELLTRIDLIGPDRIYREGPTDGVLADRYTWEATIEPELAGYLYTVSVTIEWNGPRGRATASAVTALNDPPGSRLAYLRWEDF